MTSMPPEKAHFSFVLNPTLTAPEFLEMILLDFGVETIPESKSQRLMLLQQLLLRGDRDGRTLVLIIDEAHKLTTELLEEVRLLTNFETAEHKLLQIILAGQTELTELLNREELRQLKQRIAVRVGVAALSVAEVSQYVQSRWTRAGASSDLPFTPDALRLIAGYSRGIPRVINAICDNALMNAFGDDTRVIESRHILEVASDLQLKVNGNGNLLVSAGAGLNRAALKVFTEPARVPAALPPMPEIPQITELPPIEDAPAVSFKTLERYMPAPRKNLGWLFRVRRLKG
jgi:general secretion pathway protein A